MSRQKSGRGGKKAAPARGRAAAAAPRGGRGVYVQAPKSDIFVVLLSISLGAILIGCVLLLLVWGRYDYSTKPIVWQNSSPGGTVQEVLEDLNKIPVLVS